MIYDNTLIFSDAQAVTATAASTNIIDNGATGTPFGGNALVRDVGKGPVVPVWAYVTETFNNLTSLKVTVETDSDPAFGTAKEVASRTYLLAELAAGAKLEFPAEIPVGANKRYLRVKYTVTGTAPTTGKVSVGIVAARQTNLGDTY